MDEYSLGRIIVVPIVPLSTTSEITTLRYTVSAQVVNLSTIGTIVLAST